MNKLAATTLVLTFATGAAARFQQQGSRPAPPSDRNPADVVKDATRDEPLRAEFERRLEEKGVAIDRARKLAAVRGRFNSPRMPLEYLVTAPHGSDYESLLSIGATPSDVAAALLYLGVDNATAPVRKRKEKPPTEDEMKAGATPYEVDAGKGGGVFVYVEWNDEHGFHRHRLEDLVFERPEGKSMPHARFLFTNSTMVEPRSSKDHKFYMADQDGNFLSCGFGSSAVLAYPKPHPYAMEGDFEVYQPNWTLVPSEPLPVTIVFATEEIEKPLLPRLAPTPASAPASGPAKEPR